MPAASRTEPKGTGGREIPVAQFATIVDLSLRQAQRLVAQGTVTGAGRGKVFFPLAVHQYVRWLRREQERADNGIGKGADDEMLQLKKMRERIAVQRAALELQREAATMMKVTDAVTAVSAVAGSMRTALQTVPKRYGVDGDDRRRLKLVVAEISRELAEAAGTALEALDPDAAAEERAVQAVAHAD